jgi:hypothetical protein
LDIVQPGRLPSGRARFNRLRARRSPRSARWGSEPERRPKLLLRGVVGEVVHVHRREVFEMRPFTDMSSIRTPDEQL